MILLFWWQRPCHLELQYRFKMWKQPWSPEGAPGAQMVEHLTAKLKWSRGLLTTKLWHRATLPVNVIVFSLLSPLANRWKKSRWFRFLYHRAYVRNFSWTYKSITPFPHAFNVVNPLRYFTPKTALLALNKNTGKIIFDSKQYFHKVSYALYIS